MSSKLKEWKKIKKAINSFYIPKIYWNGSLIKNIAETRKLERKKCHVIFKDMCYIYKNVSKNHNIDRYCLIRAIFWKIIMFFLKLSNKQKTRIFISNLWLSLNYGNAIDIHSLREDLLHWHKSLAHRKEKCPKVKIWRNHFRLKSVQWNKAQFSQM